MSFDLDAYLARIALPARPTQDEYGLAAVLRAHRLAIPFENLDIRLGRPIPIDGDSVFDKLVTRKRGGYCFEQNRLLRDALTALGFSVRPLLGRVWLLADPGVPPQTHTLNLITIGGQEWIADAGFGGSYAPPLELRDGATVTAPDGARHRLNRDPDHGWMLVRAAGEGEADSWQDQYSFTEARVEESDLVLANHWTSTAPDTRFTTLTLARIVLPTGHASLTGRDYSRRVSGETTEAVIEDPRVYRMRLSLMFGIDLSADEVATLWAGI